MQSPTGTLRLTRRSPPQRESSHLEHGKGYQHLACSSLGRGELLHWRTINGEYKVTDKARNESADLLEGVRVSLMCVCSECSVRAVLGVGPTASTAAPASNDLRRPIVSMRYRAGKMRTKETPPRTTWISYELR